MIVIPKPIIYCPECNSENVEVVCLTPPKPERWSIDQLHLMGTRFIPAIKIYTWWCATCTNCGYSREYKT